MQDLNLIVAFGAGVLTFVSPCTLPIYPAFLSYITGVSVTDLKNNQGMLQKKKHAAYFIFLAWLFCNLYCTGIWYKFCWKLFFYLSRFDSTNRCIYYDCNGTFSLRNYSAKIFHAGYKVYVSKPTRGVYRNLFHRACVCSWLDTLLRTDYCLRYFLSRHQA